MMLLDERQRQRLDDIEVEILDYVAALPATENIEELEHDLKQELAFFGFTLGNS